MAVSVMPAGIVPTATQPQLTSRTAAQFVMKTVRKARPAVATTKHTYMIISSVL